MILLSWLGATSSALAWAGVHRKHHRYSDTEKDYDFWVVAFHGENDETLHRKDADKDEINRMMNDPDGYCKVWREFQTEHKPKYWVVWPHSISKDWCERITGNL